MNTAPPPIGHNGGPQFDISDASWQVFFDADGHYRVSPYKVLYGGRGGGKSWDIAAMLVARANAGCERILCCREYMNSIADSSHKLISDMIDRMGLKHRFTITKTGIRCHATGSEFIFKGLKKSIMEIKSTEGITLCWVEEAQPVSKFSWDILIPTVFRRETSEMWISYNPDQEQDATHHRFVSGVREKVVETESRFATYDEKGRIDMIVAKVGWEDNPWFPAGLERERAKCLRDDQVAYDWIWGGLCRKITEAAVFKARWSTAIVDEPLGTQPRYGIDWGFADDPIACVRFWIRDSDDGEEQDLIITHEAFGHGVEMDEIPALLDGNDALGVEGIPGIRDWHIKADSARPETISYVAGKGFAISAAEKWPGSVEDGIAHLKAYRHIYINPRCVHLLQEFRLYSFKVDPKLVDAEGKPVILPIIVDRWNHGIDALRYGHDGLIQHAGGMGIWKKLASQAGKK